jgi:hypothetical protein
MSEQQARKLASGGVTLERSKDELLAAARTLPPVEEMLIEDLTDEEERLFVDAILDA